MLTRKLKSQHEEKRYYAEYCHPNTMIYWSIKTNNINDLEPMTTNLTYDQSFYIYDNRLQRVIFDKECAASDARINFLSKFDRDLRTIDGKRKR